MTIEFEEKKRKRTTFGCLEVGEIFTPYSTKLDRAEMKIIDDAGQECAVSLLDGDINHYEPYDEIFPLEAKLIIKEK